MATLTNQSYRYIQQWMLQHRAVYRELSRWGLARATLQAALQALETYLVGAFGTRPTSSLRTAIEAETGTATAAQAQALFFAWVAWKQHNLLGGE